jgi:hypothetical protein
MDKSYLIYIIISTIWIYSILGAFLRINFLRATETEEKQENYHLAPL